MRPNGLIVLDNMLWAGRLSLDAVHVRLARSGPLRSDEAIPILRESLRATVGVTTMLFLIISASTTFAQILAISGAVDGALTALGKFTLSPTMTVVSMVLVLIVLGCFMEQIAMMLLTLPFFVPIANALHLDMLWLSVVLLIALQVGLMHPPFGLLLFVMRAVAPPEITLKDIWLSTIPFVAIVLAVLELPYDTDFGNPLTVTVTVPPS